MQARFKRSRFRCHKTLALGDQKHDQQTVGACTPVYPTPTSRSNCQISAYVDFALRRFHLVVQLVLDLLYAFPLLFKLRLLFSQALVRLLRLLGFSRHVSLPVVGL